MKLSMAKQLKAGSHYRKKMYIFEDHMCIPYAVLYIFFCFCECRKQLIGDIYDKDFIIMICGCPSSRYTSPIAWNPLFSYSRCTGTWDPAYILLAPNSLAAASSAAINFCAIPFPRSNFRTASRPNLYLSIAGG